MGPFSGTVGDMPARAVSWPLRGRFSMTTKLQHAQRMLSVSPKFWDYLKNQRFASTGGPILNVVFSSSVEENLVISIHGQYWELIPERAFRQGPNLKKIPPQQNKKQILYDFSRR